MARRDCSGGRSQDAELTGLMYSLPVAMTSGDELKDSLYVDAAIGLGFVGGALWGPLGSRATATLTGALAGGVIGALHAYRNDLDTSEIWQAALESAAIGGLSGFAGATLAPRLAATWKEFQMENLATRPFMGNFAGKQKFVNSYVDSLGPHQLAIPTFITSFFMNTPGFSLAQHITFLPTIDIGGPEAQYPASLFGVPDDPAGAAFTQDIEPFPEGMRPMTCPHMKGRAGDGRLFPPQYYFPREIEKFVLIDLPELTTQYWKSLGDGAAAPTPKTLPQLPDAVTLSGTGLHVDSYEQARTRLDGVLADWAALEAEIGMFLREKYPAFVTATRDETNNLVHEISRKARRLPPDDSETSWILTYTSDALDTLTDDLYRARRWVDHQAENIQTGVPHTATADRPAKDAPHRATTTVDYPPPQPASPSWLTAVYDARTRIAAS